MPASSASPAFQLPTDPVRLEFVKIRMSGTPWCLVATPDPEETIAALATTAVPDAPDAPDVPPVSVAWSLATGHRLLVGDKMPTALGSGEATANKPSILLLAAAKLPQGSLLFFNVPSADFWRSDACVSAVVGLRSAFKATSRCLVFVAQPGAGDKLPPQLEADVPILRVALPSVEAMAKMVEDTVAGNPVAVADGDVTVAARNLRGMTLFAAENAVARACLFGKLDAASLASVQRESVEAATGGALQFERSRLTFDDVGGLTAFRDFAGRLFAGPEAPDLVVRVDEIDKVVGANATGTVADNTGISQGLLRSLLTNIEDNGYLLGVLCGCAGSGKSLSTSALGNSYNRTTLAVNFDRCKGSLVGQSEAAIQRVFDTIAALGGRRVLMLATANRMDTLPPELLSRAGGCGIWFFDAPSREQRARIWDIQMRAHGLDPLQKRPDDAGMVGRDIRNACRMASMLGCSLVEAAPFTMKTGVVSLDLLVASRIEAESRGYLDAEVAGPYRVRDVAMEEMVEAAGLRRKIVVIAGGGGKTGEA